ncbi:MAG: hypothetical protein ACW98D_03130 [Promethearchaeota archaeon]|jgi:hypothetical protein
MRTELDRNTVNLVSGILSVVALFLIIIGSIPITYPLSLFLGVLGGFGALIVGYLFPILLILLQAIIILGIVMSIIKKTAMINPKTGEDVNLKKSILILAIVNLLFILLCIYFTLIFIIFPIETIWLTISPIITIVVGVIYQNY